MAETKADTTGVRGLIDGQLDHLVDDLDDVLATLALLKKTNPTEVKGSARRSHKIARQAAVAAASVAAAKPRTGGAHGPKAPEVRVSALSSTGHLRVALILSLAVADRLGLVAKGKAEISPAGNGKIRIRASKLGIAVSGSKTTPRLRILLLAKALGVTEKHRPEAAVHHFDEHDDLIITLPNWWKTTVPEANPGPARAARKTASPTPTAPPPVSASPTGADSKARCQACKLRGAILECNLCRTVTCSGCWDEHVKSHWNKGDGSRPTGLRQAHA